MLKLFILLFHFLKIFLPPKTHNNAVFTLFITAMLKIFVNKF